MMKLNTILPLTLSSLAIISCSPALADDQPVTAATDALVEETGTAGPALWKVSDEDTTIYMFGTVHVLPDDVNWYTESLASAIDASDTLVTEIDMSPEALAAAQQSIGAKGVLPQGVSLRSLMSEEQRATYEAALTAQNIPVENLDPLKPWLASLSIGQIAFSRAGIKTENGTEEVLERLIGDEKKRVALETIEFQFSVFDTMPQDAQLRYLIETATEVDSLASSLNAIIDEWAVGDVEGVATLLNEALEGEPEFANALLYDRNKTWSEWIDTRLDEPGTVFMAVGAGHLAGEKSVQDYLSARGIQTVRVQ
ncbi:MAG: TraB/GumN family protein [Erythrobacter sp.]